MKSLKRRFLLSTLALVVAVSLATLLAAHRLVSQAMNTEVALSASRDEVLLSAALAPLVASRNLAEAEDLLRAMVRDGAFVYVEVLDSSDSPWLRAGPVPAEVAAMSLPVAASSAQRRAPDGTFHFTGGLDLDGHRYGSYRFGLSGQAAVRAEQRVLAGLVVIGLLGVLGAVLMQVPMAHWLTRRLERLADGTDRVAAGEYGLQLPPAGSDGLGRLTASFNAMSGALAQRVEALQASERRQHQLVDALAEGVVFQDAQDRVLECNAAACSILGLTRGQLLGTDSMDPRWHAIHRDGTAFDFAEHPVLRVLEHHALGQGFAEHPSVLALRTGQPVRNVLMGVNRPQGGLVWVSINSQPLRDAGVEATVTSFSDVTGRVQAELALQRANQDLEHRVAERTAELAGARDAAERANLAKTEFLSRMSHELRTPLNAILGFAQVLRMRLKPAPAGVDEQLGYIEAGGWHLLELINDVLDLSRIEAGSMVVSLESIEVAPLLAECARMVEAAAQRARVELELVPAAPAWRVRGDRTRLRQVLTNLLSNACKYNRPGGRVRLEASLDGDHLTVSVADTGVGLSPQQLARMYEPFNRLGAETGSVEGTGIGLVISRRLVDLMGGRMEVRSCEGQGTTFTVHLPLGDEPVASSTAAAAPGAAEPASTGLLDLLYVEDNAANVQLLKEVLALRPRLKVRAAGDAQGALRAVMEHPPELLVIDIALPGMDGFELCRRLRALPGLQRTPMVALSANAMPVDHASGLDAGFDRYFTKPLDVAAFLDWVDSALRSP
jgi:signal transduction histidine kinase/HAMP domain-containing protein